MTDQENQGTDDKKYIALMVEYKKARRGPDRQAANLILQKVMELGKKGDVSEKAKVGAAYSDKYLKSKYNDRLCWINTSKDYGKSLSGFMLKEQGQFIDGDPAEIAQQKGWTPDKFGWYRDGSGAVVARSIGGRMVVYDGQAQQAAKQTDMGNPTVASGMDPADRARSMGLQSDSKGGYRDQAGNMVARTVNNELVFYDDGASGGVVSDGGGGMQLTQSSPSWVDPVSGLILVPPAQPETPEELKSVPDAIPATPPQGYDSFITQRHLENHAEEEQKQEQAEEQQKQQAIEQLYDDEGADEKAEMLMSSTRRHRKSTGDWR